jgi:two-component system LytT family response regulator
MKITTLIIDDESLARQRISNLLKDVHDIEIIDVCKNGKQTIEVINKKEPQLIFLDIQMKDMTGFEVLEKIDVKKKPVVIFVTAYDEYALKAFDFFAFDYLLKPYKDERFYKSTLKAIEHIKQNNVSVFEDKLNELMDYIKNPKSNVNISYIEKLPIKLGNKISFIDTKKIKYILASGYYAEIYSDEKKHLLRESLSNLINELHPKKFIRIHRSTIINTTEVAEIINSNYGEIDVKMNDNGQFRISKSYKKEFLNRMGL